MEEGNEADNYLAGEQTLNNEIASLLLNRSNSFEEKSKTEDSSCL